MFFWEEHNVVLWPCLRMLWWSISMHDQFQNWGDCLDFGDLSQPNQTFGAGCWMSNPVFVALSLGHLPVQSHKIAASCTLKNHVTQTSLRMKFEDGRCALIVWWGVVNQNGWAKTWMGHRGIRRWHARPQTFLLCQTCNERMVFFRALVVPSGCKHEPCWTPPVMSHKGISSFGESKEGCKEPYQFGVNIPFWDKLCNLWIFPKAQIPWTMGQDNVH